MRKQAFITFPIPLILISLLSLGFTFSLVDESFSERCEKIVQFDKVVAEKRGNKIILINWITLKETESFKFIIERSENNENFYPIGEVGANRNSQIPINYNFSDLSPLEGQTYYRIQVVNKDQRSDYSSTLSVFFDSENKGLQLIQAFPNPFLDTVRVHYSLPEKGGIQYHLYSEKGKEILAGQKTVPKGENTIVLVKNDLPKGRYILGLMGKDKVLKAVELLKK